MIDIICVLYLFGDVMRVITGSAKGRRLVTPEGIEVRPTAERVKEALFSAINFDIEGRRVLDLFAGSGQLAVEALSRGADSAVLVDNSAASIKVAKANIENCGFADKARLVQIDYQSFCAMSRDIFDIVFLDPPYNKGMLMPALKAVLPLVSDYGMIICEHTPEVKPEQNVGGFSIYRTYKYGKVSITIYKRSEAIEG